MNLDKIYLNIALINECTEIEGPGKRFCIWLQGCNIGCQNCINEEMLSFDAKNILSVSQIIKLIKNAKIKYNIEGITFLGGEPTLQAKGLTYLAKYCKENELSTLCFSGFKYEQLLQRVVPESNELLSYLDILIDGKYIESLEDDSRNWIGSKNQKFYYLTNKYDNNIEIDEQYRNKVEISISDESILINGEANIVKEFKNEY